MKSGADEDDDDDVVGRTTIVVDQILTTCDSITKRALSCRTFGTKTRQKQIAGDGEDIVALIQKEHDTAAWLERQMLDYRVYIILAQQQLQVDHIAETSPEEITRLQGEIFDESVRIQQEHMLFSRIAMSEPAIQAILPPLSRDDEPEPKRSERILLKQAIRERDNKTTVVLETKLKLDQLRMEMEQVTMESLQLQQKNHAVWGELQSQQKARLGEYALDNRQNDGSLEQNADEIRIDNENQILRRVLLDIIIESRIDWYSDDRLRTALLKLEND